jgi:8-oxo-dGTP pyrophosphatase MutT (NUDIX family)
MTDMPQQACAVPYRRQGDRIEFCLITTAKGRWIFPKGIVDPGEVYEETALKESLEEAGLHGEIVGSPLGSYELPKFGTCFEVIVVLMRVERCDETWLEDTFRRRCWASAEEAHRLLDRPHLQVYLDTAVSRLASQNQDSREMPHP